MTSGHFFDTITNVKNDTLVLNGCMRKDGNTAFLLQTFLKGQTDCVVVDKTAAISACHNCNTCRDGSVCAVSDGMQDVYRVAENAKRVVIASPVYFGNVTGFLLDILSRFQQYFQNGYDSLPRIGSKKEGLAILTAGGYGDVSGAEKTVRLLFSMLNVQNPEFVTSYQTDKLSANDDKAAVSQVLDVRKRWFG